MTSTTEERLREAYSGMLAARGPGERAACPAPEAVLALVRREGAEPERLATLDHVMSCRECRAEFDLLRAVERAGAEAEGRKVGATSAGRRSWYVPAALAATVVLAVALGRGLRQPGADEPLRGGANELALIAPRTDVQAGAPLAFVWHPVPDASRYVVEVLTTDGNVALTAESTDTTVAPAAAPQLAAGDYQWWVRAARPDGSDVRSPLRPLRVHSR